MNKLQKFLCISILLTLSLSTFTVNALSIPETPPPTPNAKEGFLVMDTDRDSPLPKRYRNLPALNISGSAQFEPSQIENLKNEINVLDTYIVDLRQESHGFLNDDAVSFYSTEKLLNNGFNSEETLTSEKEKFGAIKAGDVENIFNKRGAFREEIKVDTSQIELNLVRNTNLNYVLFATRDGHIPTPSMVDSFVAFIAKTPPTTHLHFHCDHGEGRTTMFMAMFQMMKESNLKSLNEILDEQLKAGGIILTDETTRAEFLQDFYDYTKSNTTTNFKTPFSVWTQKSSTSNF
ncbi:MAG: phosphatase [Clostridium sp.]